MAVRYKRFGTQEYAYKIWNEKDEKTGKWVQRSQYLGVVADKEKGVYEKRGESRKRQSFARQELCVIDYGDSYFLSEAVSGLPVFAALKNVFEDSFDTLMTLVFHRIISGQAMRYVQSWHEGNYASLLFPGAKASSQGVSEFLSRIGRESVLRAFFREYIPLVQKGGSSIVIDSTGLPNEISMPLTDWGYHNGGVEFETRLILAIDKESKLPLYFRHVAGNVGDVSTLANTIAEMRKFGVSALSALIDAGYFSQDNLGMLFAANIAFLIRMPSNRNAYKSIISECADIESMKHSVRHGKRGLFVKERKIEIYGHEAFAYLVLDPERRGREIAKAIAEANDGGSECGSADLSGCGKMVLLSSEKIATQDVVPLYYTRQIAERMFGIAKSDLGILPLRTHSEPNFKGFMLLVFIALVFSCHLKERLGKKFSVEMAMAAMRNMKAKVFDDAVLPGEPTKLQKEIMEAANVVVPNVGGI